MKKTKTASKKSKKPDLASQVIGMGEAEARAFLTKNKIMVRVRSINGVPQMGTCDMQPNRVNLHLENGKVDSTSLG